MIERIGPFRVECSRDQMKVALNHSRFPLLEQETATLLDPKCKAYNEDGAHVFIKTPLDGCGTFHNYSNDGRYLIYYNQVIMKLKKYKPGDVITRDHLAVFDFECRYHRRTVMSVVHFNPARGTVYSEAGKEFTPHKGRNRHVSPIRGGGEADGKLLHSGGRGKMSWGVVTSEEIFHGDGRQVNLSQQVK